ncbi:unnamed protein product [Pieris brassicae]|uniref:Endonuclease/exonuclease/phosphatase domain-containing protein n=1 Tax=Pieris brassicae TaxID=7116 RepID=A0A9P0SV14_PIEBR|nr:unnamed protein product [Pieris brassicae]
MPTTIVPSTRDTALEALLQILIAMQKNQDPTPLFLKAAECLNRGVQYNDLLLSRRQNHPGRGRSSVNSRRLEREGPPLERHQNLATWNTITARRRCTSLRGHRAGRPDLGPDQTAWVPDTIDLVVYRGFPGRIALDVLVDEFLSDHQPVVAELSDSTPSTTPTQSRRTIDWSVFQTTLDAAPLLPTPSNAQEIDDTAVKLTSLIQNALTASTTTENPKIIEDRLPGRLMKLIAEKEPSVVNGRRLAAHVKKLI